MNHLASSIPQHDRRRRLAKAKLIRALLAILIVYPIDFYFEHELPESPLTRSVFQLGSLYQYAVIARRTPAQRSTAIIEIGGNGISQNNLCGPDGQREFLARLIVTLVSAHPSVIAIDKHFGLDSCPPGDTGTRKLKAAIAKASLTVPVVIGRLAEQRNRTLEPSLGFQGAGPQRVFEGLINRDPDDKRLALQWSVREENQSGLKMVPTLALAAAQACRSCPLSLDQGKRLGNLLKQDIHPFIGFIDASEFKVIKGAKVLQEGAPANFQQLLGKIIILGEAAKSDIHNTVVGEVPGYFLQANYVEALLDDRYYMPKPWLDFVVGFAVFALIWLTLNGLGGQHRTRGARRWDAFLLYPIKIVIVTLLLVAAYETSYLLAVHLGWYVNPAVGSLVSLTYLLLDFGLDAIKGQTESA